MPAAAISIATAQVRAGMLDRLRAAGPEYAMLAAFVAIGTNLLDFATAPLPGEGATAGFVTAAIVRILAIFYATYAIERRMTAVALPLRPGIAFLRFSAFAFVSAVLFGVFTGGGSRLLGGGGMELAERWLLMIALTALWGVVVIRLIGWAAALAMGKRFRDLPQAFRGLRGAARPLAFAFIQLVLPFAAIHAALTLIGLQLPLSGTAVAALALVDGVVSAIQLLLTCALSVVALRIGERRAGALREGAAGR